MLRREFLRRAAGGGISLSLLGLSTHALSDEIAQLKFSKQPFTLGVASGDPSQTEITLWTKLAPEPNSPDYGMPQKNTAVRWELAADPKMHKIIQSGWQIAPTEFGHSVHVNIDGLASGQRYWFRFSTDEWESPIGQTNTLPAGSSPIRIASVSCQHYEQGFFHAFRHLVKDQPDFVIHLGDYIYDTSFGRGIRNHDSDGIPTSLATYRRRHTLYRLDQDLQHAHASLPFFVTLDNHDAVEFSAPEHMLRRVAAYQAWYEFMPIRRPMPTIMRTIEIGSLAKIIIPDTRQFRDNQTICADTADPNYGFGIYMPDCKERLNTSRSMLGANQLDKTIKSLVSNQANWNVIASSVPFSPFTFYRGGQKNFYYGGWDGYPAERRKILDVLIQLQRNNTVVISGDVHSSWVTETRDEKTNKTSLIEFIGTSISSGWPQQLSGPIQANISNNPQVSFYSGTHRGYALHDISSAKWRTTMRAVMSATDRSSLVFDQAKYEIPAGEMKLYRYG